MKPSFRVAALGGVYVRDPLTISFLVLAHPENLATPRPFQHASMVLTCSVCKRAKLNFADRPDALEAELQRSAFPEQSLRMTGSK